MSLPSSQQTAIWKAMPLTEKVELFTAMIRQAREFKRMGIRMRYPEFSPEEVEQKLARIWLHARP